MQAYKEYKEVNAIWLQRIPIHWNMQKTKHLFKERVEKGFPDEPLLVASQNMGVVPKDVYGSRTVEATKDLHLLKLVKISDFVISLRSFQGGIEYAHYQGIISPAYTVMVAKGILTPQYFKHLAKSKPFIELLKLCVTGIREGQNIDYERLKNHLLPIPPREEQGKIVQFLGHKLEKIHKFIANKQKLIALLEEQKQAIIHQAVTKGLDLNAPMKDSGIDWLGEVPKHWDVTQVRKFYHIQLGKMLQPTQIKSDDTLAPYVCALNVYWDRIDVHNLKNMWFSPIEKEKYKLEKGDLIVVEGGDVATAQIWTAEIECYMQNAVHRVREKQGSLNTFLYYWLLMLKKRAYFEQICSKATLAHFTKEKFLSLILLRPPLEEQKNIAEYLLHQCKKIDTLIAKYQKEIDLIQEYKTSLISAVVTGQVDVGSYIY